MEDLDEKIRDHLAETRGPSVTPQHIESIIVSTEYHRLTATLTVAVLTLANGFTVTGESACAAPENYNQEIGERLAFDDAKRKIWPLEGYMLKTRIQLLADQASAARVQQLDDELEHGVAPFLSFRDVASIAYEANRRLRHVIGDGSDLPPWRDAGETKRDGLEAGVGFHVEHPDASPVAAHQAWLDRKVADGWVYGLQEDAEASPPTHPNILPYDDLPDEQKAKDYLFRGIVHSLWPFIVKPAPVAREAELPPRDAAPAE